MVADQGRGGAVQEIGAGRADLPVRAGNLDLDPVRGTALTAGESLFPPGRVRGFAIFSPPEVTVNP